MVNWYAADMKEVEILIEVKSTKEAALMALSRFESKGSEEVLDVYFVNSSRPELQPDLSGRLFNSYRLRKKGCKASMAYKVDHFLPSGEWSHSDEYETGVEDFDAVMEINKKLGFEELIRVDNIKHKFLTEDYEIVLEEVKDLGLFLEVEKLSEVSDNQVTQTKEEIRSFLKTLNIEFGEEQNAGKPELLLRKRR